MKQLLLAIPFCIVINTSFAQNNLDSQTVVLKKNSTITDTSKLTIPKEKFLNTIYFRTMPFCLYTGADYMKDKISQNIEIGKSFGIIDVGVALGRNALRRDSANNGTTYIEGKVTMEIAQYGIFSNEMIVGAGYVPDSKNFLMLELSYTIYAQFWNRVGLGLTTGFNDFSGDKTDNTRNTFGIFCRYGLKRPEGGILNGIPRARHMTKVHHRR